MRSPPATLPALEVSSVWSFVLRAHGLGVVDGSLKRNRWHQPDVVCVIEEGRKTIFVLNPAPAFVVEDRRMLVVLMRLRCLSPRCPLTSSLEQLFAAL